MNLTENDALKTYAKMMNTLDATCFAPILAEDFVYESQSVITSIKSKQDFLEYITKKLEIISTMKATVYAEFGHVNAFGRERPCVILAQDDKDTLQALALATVSNNRLKRIDLCIIPPPESAKRSGKYPKIEASAAIQNIITKTAFHHIRIGISSERIIEGRANQVLNAI